MPMDYRLRAGELRDRCLIERRSGAQSASGEFTDTWTAVGSYWGRMEALSAVGARLAAGVISNATYQLTLRRNTAVTNDCRVTTHGVVYYVDGIVHSPPNVSSPWTMVYLKTAMA